MQLQKILLCAVTIFTVISSRTSYAHTPYLYPSSFEVSKKGIVSLDASFAEKFFVPEVAFNDSIFHIVTPQSHSITPDTIMKLNLRTAVEHKISDDGTYRFSTGRRLGRVFKIYEIDGERKSLENPQDPVPAGGKLLSFFQSDTMAETYVTKGAPDKGALVAYNQGLEFVALTHPNDLFVGESIKLRSQFEGDPLARLKIDIFLANNQFSDEKPLLTTESDSKGEFSFTPKQAGNYLLRARHRSKAPAGSDAPEISNTYTLVLEAAE
ncbi:DUF4198 domain-containing protein [Neptunicella sp. SCSIO 80796]|uniref:DUF4198 domain-containing protein n=1 Tax=Neptunicella plasticusilytica TaxID=3117012 RepID=UPI003A4DC3F3